MSFKDENSGIADIEEARTEDAAAEMERASGFVVKRRRLLWLPVFTAMALMPDSVKNLFARDEARQNAENKPAELDWQDFLERGVPVVRELHQDNSARGQDAYLYELAHWAARLRRQSIPRTKLYPFEQVNPAVHFGVSYKGVPFFVVEWWLEPGAALPPHCHPNASVCTLGIEGEARVRNYEIVGAAPAFTEKDTFRVRETHNEFISAGRINCLSAARDNIHTFQAGKAGARGVDFSTYHGKDIGFSFLNITDKPLDSELRIFEATWRKI